MRRGGKRGVAALCQRRWPEARAVGSALLAVCCETAATPLLTPVPQPQDVTEQLRALARATGVQAGQACRVRTPVKPLPPTVFRSSILVFTPSSISRRSVADSGQG